MELQATKMLQTQQKTLQIHKAWEEAPLLLLQLDHSQPTRDKAMDVS